MPGIHRHLPVAIHLARDFIVRGIGSSFLCPYVFGKWEAAMFSSVGLPHGFCFLWDPKLLWLHVISDGLIALAYFLIPIALVRIIRKRKDVPYHHAFLCFAAFIVSCGITHVFEIVTLWHPIYWVSGTIKALTAIISLVTVVVLVRITPTILGLPKTIADERFRELIEDAPDAILQVDAAGTIVIANKTAELIFGYTRQQLLGSNVDLLVPQANRGAHPAHRHELAHSGVARTMGKGRGDLHARRRDGSEISVEIALSPSHSGDDALVTAVIRDVTARKTMERELERANQQFTSVLDCTNVGIYALDTDWIIRYVNDNARRLLHSAGEIVGEDLWAAFPNMEQASDEAFRRVMETRQPETFDSYYPPLDLSSHVSVHPWNEAGGNCGITVYFNDISEQRRLEAKLDKERALRNQRIEVLARLSSNLAHEIRNPLAIIHARASDLAAEGPVEVAEIEKSCASILRTSDRAIRILRGVAAMARTGANDPLALANICDILQQAHELVAGRFRASGISLETEIAPGLPLLQCREVQISQILVNLLNNAFDAIESDPRSERWVRVIVSLQPGSQHQNDIDRLQISVVDGGPGVAPEHKERLMQTFFTTKTMGAGIGIGLSVSRTIAEDHGGQLELRERDGHTCFRLTLPISAVDVPVVPQEREGTAV